jgi:anaerobic magnesium-protoporphyrin IX monomethyl ester cyclase
MSDVLIGQSYFLRFDRKLWEAMQPYPPLGSLYAASWLRARGLSVSFFDAMLAESEQEWERALRSSRAPIAVLYEDNFNYLSKMCLLRMRQAAFAMIEAALARGCTVIVAGSDATDHAALYLDHGAHYALLGEGEETLGVLMDRLGGAAIPLEQIEGLVWQDGGFPHGGLRANARRPVMRDLDALPLPAWDLVDMERYRQAWLRRHGYFSLNMVTTRGCPYHCNWCAKPIWGQRYNVRSPQNVVDEMVALKERYHPDHLWFMDDILGLKPGWIEQFADLLEARSLRIPFKSLNRADLLLRGDTIEALRRAGARTVWIGAESGSQKILDAMEKGTRVEQVYEAARRLQEAGIEVAFFIQFGDPGETRADIDRTLRMIWECEPDDIGISVSYPLPGTRFFEAVKTQLGLQRQWTDSSDLAMLYRGPFTTGFYRRLHAYVHRGFRARAAWRELRRRLGKGAARPRKEEGKSTGTLLRSLLVNLALLPLGRLQMELLSRRRFWGLGPLSPEMNPEQAASPSPQPEEAEWRVRVGQP